MNSFLLLLLIASLIPDLGSVPNDRSEEPPPKQHQTNASPNPKASANQQSEKRQAEQKKQGNYWNQLLDWCGSNTDTVNAIGTASQAIFAGAIILLTAFIWWSETGRAEQELRAYICVTKFLAGPLDPGDNLHAMVKVRNCGQTPAYNIKTRSAVWITKVPSYDYPFQKWKRTNISIGPDRKMTVDPYSVEIVTVSQAENVQNEKLGIYVCGEIEYTGVFHSKWRFWKRPYRTCYRGFWLGFGARDHIVPLRPSEDGNRCT